MNKQVLIRSLNIWLSNIMSTILPGIGNTPGLNKVNNFIGSLLGYDLSQYSIVKEFSFLFMDLFSGSINKYVDDFLNAFKIEDKDIPTKVNNILTSCINRCSDVGHINIFGLQFEAKAFEDLRSIFNNQLNNTNVTV